MDRYIFRRDTYVAALTRKSEREAARFLSTGEAPADIIAPLAEAKEDGTRRTLAAYQERLANLAEHGRYQGSITLQRMRSDGSWEPVSLQ